MLQTDRFDQIYEILKSRGSATVQYLQKHLYVSEATIRRDLEAMENAGLIERVWGGAMLRSMEKDIPSFVRAKTNVEKKDQIASVAAKLLKNSSSIFLDSSSTCLSLVPYLAKLKDITVITNSLKMSYQLAKRTELSTIVLGGQIYEDYILSGHMAVDSVKNYHTNLLFFSCSGISTDGGIWSIEPKVVAVCREMMRHTAKKVLLCDSSKFGKTLLWRLADLADIDYIISDGPPEDPSLRATLGDKLILRADQLP